MYTQTNATRKFFICPATVPAQDEDTGAPARFDPASFTVTGILSGGLWTGDWLADWSGEWTGDWTGEGAPGELASRFARRVMAV